MAKTVNQIIKDIKSLKIQGARNVAKAAIEAIAIQTENSKARTLDGLYSELLVVSDKLAGARPTEPMVRNSIVDITRFALMQMNMKKPRTVKQVKKLILEHKKDLLRRMEKDAEKLWDYGAKLIPKNAGTDLLILPVDIPSYADKEKLKDLADNYVLLAQPNLMGQVAKSLGQYLGPRGKLPKPITGNPAGMVERAKKTVRIVTKGKYLPVLQVFVGTEKMSEDELVDNMEAVFDTIRAKVPDSNIKSVYVKLTMGKPIKAM